MRRVVILGGNLPHKTAAGRARLRARTRVRRHGDHVQAARFVPRYARCRS